MIRSSSLENTGSLRIQSRRFIIVCLIALAEAGCWEGVTRDVEATVLAVEGTTSVSAGRDRQFVPLLAGAHPGKGAIIETAASSRAAIALLPNILIQLDQTTRIEVGRLALAKDGNETSSAMRGRYAEVNLPSGRLFVSHDWGEARAQLIVTTPRGEVITSSNTLFCVQVDERQTRVTCAAGSVEFRPSKGGSATPIPPGHLGEWSTTSSTVVAADKEARGQADLEEALEAEQKLRALRDRTRNVPPTR